MNTIHILFSMQYCLNNLINLLRNFSKASPRNYYKSNFILFFYVEILDLFYQPFGVFDKHLFFRWSYHFLVLKFPFLILTKSWSLSRQNLINETFEIWKVKVVKFKKNLLLLFQRNATVKLSFFYFHGKLYTSGFDLESWNESLGLLRLYNRHVHNTFRLSYWYKIS